MKLKPIWIIFGGIAFVLLIAPTLGLFIDVGELSEEYEFLRPILLGAIIMIGPAVIGLLELSKRES